MKLISSKDNSIIKTAKQLQQKKFRDKTGTFLIEGYHLLEEALKSRMLFDFVVFSEEVLDKTEARALVALLEENHIDCYKMPDQIFQTLVETESPQGVVGAVHKPKWDERAVLHKPEGNILVLDRLQDPGNVGTMIRTAEAAGYRAILAMKGTVDIYGSKVIRSAMGSLFRMPVLYCDSPTVALEKLEKAGKSTVCTTLDTGVYYHQISLSKNVAIIIGNEGSGICHEFKAGATHKVKIPMQGEIESLNAAMAAGILMYEGVRGQESEHNHKLIDRR